MRQAGAGTDWLFPFVDGAPPIGWEEASAYLVLPVALVLAQVSYETYTRTHTHAHTSDAQQGHDSTGTRLRCVSRAGQERIATHGLCFRAPVWSVCYARAP